MESGSQQEGLLEITKRLFAEQGFQIFPVREEHRTDDRNFLALMHNRPQHMFLVQPLPDGVVEVRPYQAWCLFDHLWQRVELYAHAKDKLKKGEVLAADDNSSGWLDYLSDEDAQHFQSLA